MNTIISSTTSCRFLIAASHIFIITSWNVCCRDEETTPDYIILPYWFHFLPGIWFCIRDTDRPFWLQFHYDGSSTEVCDCIFIRFKKKWRKVLVAFLCVVVLKMREYIASALRTPPTAFCCYWVTDWNWVLRLLVLSRSFFLDMILRVSLLHICF